MRSRTIRHPAQLFASGVFLGLFAILFFVRISFGWNGFFHWAVAYFRFIFGCVFSSGTTLKSDEYLKASRHRRDEAKVFAGNRMLETENVCVQSKPSVRPVVVLRHIRAIPAIPDNGMPRFG